MGPLLSQYRRTCQAHVGIQDHGSPYESAQIIHIGYFWGPRGRLSHMDIITIHMGYLGRPIRAGSYKSWMQNHMVPMWIRLYELHVTHGLSFTY